ncbi:Acetoacetate decarboxylase (ADC) [Prauserella sp. Am3]|nr:Acetoacetate decarboxylase (ADC) [Prauserella sp. Am3]
MTATPKSSTPSSEYPPAPWNLTANAYLSLWTVPAADVPRLPTTAAPLTIGSTALVFTAWFDYLPSGQMSYHELLAAVAVQGGRTPTGTVTEIWVDSPASMAGGRALWAIPKDLADLDFTYGRGFTATAGTGEDWIATAAFSPRPGPPVRLPATFAIRQEADGVPLTSAVRSTARPQAAASSWNINPSGPLGYLAGHRPRLSLHLGDARIRFGA